MEIVGTIFSAIIAAVTGHFPAYLLVRYFTQRVDKVALEPKEAEESKEAESLKTTLTCLIGVAERAIVTALMIHRADLVPWFIGAWVLLKFAGGWKRYVDPSPRNRAIYQVALLGNVVSIGIAVLIGLAYIHLSVASLAPSTTPP
jgi:hypothetical protein